MARNEQRGGLPQTKEIAGRDKRCPVVIGGHDSARDTTCLREFQANLYAHRGIGLRARGGDWN